jgi:hypothetical protein
MQAFTATRPAARPVAPAHRASVQCNAQVRLLALQRRFIGISLPMCAVSRTAAAAAG